MFLTKKFLDRRTFLRGAGVALALPLLDAMIPAHTLEAQTAAAPVRRFGVTYLPNGVVVPKYWTPTTTGSDFELTTILKPFEPVRDHMVVVSGLSSGPMRAGGHATVQKLFRKKHLRRSP